MSWNYRIVKTETGYGLFEVYYDKNGKPTHRTCDPIDFGAYESVLELAGAMGMAYQDMTKHDPLDDEVFE